MRHFYIIFLIFLTFFTYAQDSKNDSLKIKSINEISYEYLIAPGYSHLWNIKDRMLFGIGTHIGIGKSLIPEYSDLFLFKVITRNTFSKKPFQKDKYDLGLFFSLSFQHEAYHYGLTTAYYFNIGKHFKIGIYSLIGLINSEKFFFTITPGISYKFTKTK